MKKKVAATLALALALVIPGVGPSGASDTALKPYVLAERIDAPFAGKVDAVRQSLTGAGFEIAGEYAFGQDAVIIVVTDDVLRAAAAQTDLGGYGAAQRVSVTRVGESVQVAFTNPRWMAAIYRMGTDLAAVADRLGQALGRLEQFGTKKGLSAEKLGKYHYMALMPYFDDGELLADHGSYVTAVEKVEQGLAAASGAAKVYRVDIPGKEQSLFGAAILEGKGADATVMENCDKTTLRHTAHLPYELLVSGGKVLMLHGKFRIAQSFPDLTMGTFMKISGAPNGIEKALRAAVQ